MDHNAQHDSRTDSHEMTPQTTKRPQQLYAFALLGLVLGLLIGGVALATVISLWLTSSTQTTTTTTIGSIVVTNTTIPTTATTTTTSSTTATTATTSTSSTTATTTTTSTSSTTATTTTSSTSSTTATTATTTTTPVTTCPTSNVTANNYLSPGTPLFSTYTINIACTTFIRVAWLYIAQSGNETISITTYNVPATTYIDDVSIIDLNTSQQLLTNGGFENGTLAWTGAAVSSISSGGAICNTGSWCYMDSTVIPHGSIVQSVTTTPGHTLSISFYISWSGTGVIYNNITITP